MTRKALSALLLPALLAACGGDGAVQSASGKPAKPPARSAAKPAANPPPRQVAVRAPVKAPPPAPKRQVQPGLEGVIGATPDALVRRFGPARLDVYEGDARKLQFVGNACVLDIYLYPPAPGREVEASYVEARRASDAQDVDDVACVNALGKR